MIVLFSVLSNEFLFLGGLLITVSCNGSFTLDEVAVTVKFSSWQENMGLKQKFCWTISWIQDSLWCTYHFVHMWAVLFVAWCALNQVCSMTELQCFHASTSKYRVEWIFAKPLLLLFGECKRIITEICRPNYTLWQLKAAEGSRWCLLIAN